MLEGAWFADDLEVRRAGDGSARLRGSFPYGKAAVLSDGGRTGRPKKEIIAPRAFAYRVEAPDKEIHLLLGHDFGQPLASKLTKTLFLKDTAAALIFDAIISREIAETSFGRDVLAMVAAGLAFGISPGFRIPPRRAVPKAEEVTEEPDDGSPDANGEPQHGAIIRTVLAALLYELSIVTRLAYKDSQIEARSWQPTLRPPAPDPSLAEVGSMIEVTAQSEAPPATYPAVTGVTGDALVTAWQRIEHYVIWRFSARLVTWRLDSSGGEWSLPLRPLSGEMTAGIWDGAGFAPVTLAPAPGGFRIPPGRYEIAAVVGAGPVPAAVAAAVKRLADYLAAESALPAGLRSYSATAGQISETVSGDPAIAARALALRGEAVFLIRDRLVPVIDWDLSTRDSRPRAYRLSVPEVGGGARKPCSRPRCCISALPPIRAHPGQGRPRCGVPRPRPGCCN